MYTTAMQSNISGSTYFRMNFWIYQRCRTSVPSLPSTHQSSLSNQSRQNCHTYTTVDPHVQAYRHYRCVIIISLRTHCTMEWYEHLPSNGFIPPISLISELPNVPAMTHSSVSHAHNVSFFKKFYVCSRAVQRSQQCY